MNRIRIVSVAGELELEGDKDFMAEYQEVIAAMADQLMDRPTGNATPAGARGISAAGVGLSEMEFGEALHQLPKGASGTDQILLAGQYAARDSDTDTFSTRDANQLLLDQGVKLANASQSLKHNLTAKRVFKVDGKYRVSRVGVEHLSALTTSEGSQS